MSNELFVHLSFLPTKFYLENTLNTIIFYYNFLSNSYDSPHEYYVGEKSKNKI
jgi:hypothetical protein